MIIITTQIEKEVLIEESTFAEYCEKKGMDYETACQLIREGEIDVDHLAYLTTQDTQYCSIRKARLR